MTRREAWWLAVVVALTLVGAGCGSGDEPAAPAPRTIAFLRAVVSNQPENQNAFLDALQDEGYIEGDNLTILAKAPDEVHTEAADAEQAVRAWQAAGADLVIALSTGSAKAAAAAAPGLDVLFLVNDPVASGLVTDERRPGGRLTGVTFRVPADRTLDLIRRTFAGIAAVGVLFSPDDPASQAVRDQAVRAAAGLGVTVLEAAFGDESGAVAAVQDVRSRGAGAVWLLNSPTAFRFAGAVESAATAASLPVVTNTARPAALLTLQPDAVELYRQLASQVARVLGGTPIAEVPVENPSRFVVDVNLRAAAQLGITVPDEVQSQAGVRITR